MDDPPSQPRRHVIISGGTRGLGRGLIEGLLDAGFRVSTFGREPTPFVERLADDPNFFFQPADLRDRSTLQAFLAGAGERFGVCQGLVNCAGVAVESIFATMRDDQIDTLLSVNLRGTITFTRMVVRQMMRHQGGGSIVNISSIVGQRGYRGLAVYSATKAGLDGLTRALARELGSHQIRVNSVAPGYLRTEMTGSLDESKQEKILRRTPLKRLGVPEDVIGPVKFLLSDDSRFVTGHVLVVDGGISS
jgi:3-oxoacyl-[acyl-carrier protein] reductase